MPFNGVWISHEQIQLEYYWGTSVCRIMLWHNNERGCYNTVGRILKVAMYLLKHSAIKIHFLHTFAIHRHYSCQILLQDTFCTSPYLLFFANQYLELGFVCYCYCWSLYRKSCVLYNLRPSPSLQFCLVCVLSRDCPKRILDVWLL